MTEKGLCSGLTRTTDLQGDADGTGRFPKDGDVVWVTPKGLDVPLHPGNGHVLVLEPVVP